MSLSLRCVGALALVCAVGGCGRSSVAPSPRPAATVNPPAADAQATIAVEVLSGATRSAVSGARVVIGGREYSTDARGRVPAVDVQALQSDVEIQADGYLPRLTRLTQQHPSVTLWPVANDEEAQAVRSMAFNHDRPRDVLSPFDGTNFYITIPAWSPELNVAWTAAALEFSRFGITYTIGGAFQYDINELEVVFTRDSRFWCTPSPLLGFCRSSSPDYRIFAVPPDRQTDPVTMRRVLASQFISANPLPGLLNPDQPAETLSPLEIQTIRMILQRPFQTRWPDDDRH